MKTTTETITLEQIRSLSTAAGEAGDLDTVRLCGLAELAVYDGERASPAPRDQHAPSLESVVDIIRESEAMDDSEPERER